MTRPLIHPRRDQGRADFFPHTCSIGEISTATGLLAPMPALSDLPCAFSNAQGGAPAMWQKEAPTGDVILLRGYFPQIRIGSLVHLTLRGESTARVFKVGDRVTDGQACKTLLALSAK